MVSDLHSYMAAAFFGSYIAHITGCLMLPLQTSSTADNADFPGVGGAATAAQGVSAS